MFSLSAEFPNDNPLLHRGVRWVCLEPTGLPTAEYPEPERAEPVAIAVTPEPTTLVAAVEDITRAVDGLLAAALEAEVRPEILAASIEVVHEAIVTVEAKVATPEAEAPRSPIVALAPLMTTSSVVEPTTEIAFEIESIVEAAPEPRPSGIVLKGESLDVAVHGVTVQDDEDVIVVEELEPVAIVCVEGLGEEPATEEAPRTVEEPAAMETTLPPAPDDPFTILVCTLSDVALATGSPHVASLVATLLHEAEVDTTGLADGAKQLLREAAILDGSGVTEAFRTTTNAWKALLRGSSDDFMACGGSMLDEWASELLARFCGSMDKAPAMRRELRNRGVAAFGLAA